MMPNKHVTFHLSAGDFAAAARCATWTGVPWRQRFLRVALTLVVTLLGWRVLTQGRTPWVGDVLFALGIALGVPLVLGFWGLPWLARRQFAQMRSMHGEARVEWDEDGLSLSGVGAQGRTRWSYVHRWQEDARCILLYQSGAAYQPIPKRVLAPEQVDDMRNLAARAGVPGAALTRSPSSQTV